MTAQDENRPRPCRLVTTPVSIVTTCKGRLEHLRRTLPLMLDQDISCEYTVIVVDYGDPDDCFGWLQGLSDPRVQGLKVLDKTRYFHQSRSRNCGASVAQSAVLCFVDADMLLGKAWLATMTAPLFAGKAALVAHAGPRKVTGMGGTVAVLRSAWMAVRGYNEEMRGYGPERKEFEQRILKVGDIWHEKDFEAEQIHHDAALRMKHYPYASLEASRAAMYEIWRASDGSANPEGFGRAQVQFGERVYQTRDGSVYEPG